MTVRDLLSDETKWCKGAYGRDEHGNGVSDFSQLYDCKSWCLLGAIIVCNGDLDSKQAAEERVKEAISWNRLGYVHLPNWNDAPERTFAEVRRVVEKAEI